MISLKKWAPSCCFYLLVPTCVTQQHGGGSIHHQDRFKSLHTALAFSCVHDKAKLVEQRRQKLFVSPSQTPLAKPANPFFLLTHLYTLPPHKAGETPKGCKSFGWSASMQQIKGAGLSFMLIHELSVGGFFSLLPATVRDNRRLKHI